MSGKNTRSTTIIGGIYKESCALYESVQLYGSGVRALELFQLLDKERRITFISCCNEYTKYIKARYDTPTTTLSLFESHDVTFFYEHPFRVSLIEPRSAILYQDRHLLTADGDEIVVYGMIDADFQVVGNKVVYDPQTSNNPLSFKESGSKANQLVLCLNANEAKVMSGESEIIKQRDFFFETEDCYALIIKNGTHGATVFTSKTDGGSTIPVYKTNKIHSIGTGDVFTAFFAHCWFKDMSITDAVNYASMAVACYSETGDLKKILPTLQGFSFEALKPKESKQIYLAGPFFSYSQRWLQNEFRNALLQEGANVFSPLHDVGYGNAKEVTQKDIDGLKNSSVVLAIVDGLDSGTLFEVGYAVALGKKVVAYKQTETEKSLQMLEGTGCDIEDDFTTAIYKAIWYAEN